MRYEKKQKKKISFHSMICSSFRTDGDNDCGDNSDESPIFCRSIQCNTSMCGSFTGFN
jgi:hypothetical protein